MIVIRNVFRLKFGKAREAVALFKEGIAIQKRVGAGSDFSTRLLTDVTGPFYTVVLEITVPNLAAFEARGAPAHGGQRLAGELSEDRAAGGVWVSRSLHSRGVGKASVVTVIHTDSCRRTDTTMNAPSSAGYFLGGAHHVGRDVDEVHAWCTSGRADVSSVCAAGNSSPTARRSGRRQRRRDEV